MNAADLNNLLTVMQIIVILGGGMFFLYRMEGKIQLVTVAQTGLTNRLEKVDEKLEQLTGVIVQLAKQEQRMDATDLRLQELSTRIDGMTHIYELGYEGNKIIRRRKK